MAIQLSNLTFTEQDDIVPAFGVEEIFNTGVANALAGNDRITGTGGIINETDSTLYTDEGNDIINGVSTAADSSGIVNRGSIDTGNGNDIITGINTNSNASGEPSGLVNFGNLYTGNGDDTITGTGGNKGIWHYSFFSLYYKINDFDTGDGNDIITGIGTDTGFLNYSGSIITGEGNDIITGISGLDGIANAGAGEGVIDTGGGDDKISGTGGNKGIYNAYIIDTGDGSDIITGTSTTEGGYSIYNEGSIHTGNDNDSIIANGGIYSNSGAINMGNGNDSIITNEGFEGLNYVSLGEGEDYLKGFGSGEFSGGNGNDTLELTPGTYTIRRWYTAVTFTKDSSVMITSEFEKRIGGSTTYDFSSLTKGQTITVA